MLQWFLMAQWLMPIVSNQVVSNATLVSNASGF